MTVRSLLEDIKTELEDILKAFKVKKENSEELVSVNLFIQTLPKETVGMDDALAPFLLIRAEEMNQSSPGAYTEVTVTLTGCLWDDNETMQGFYDLFNLFERIGIELRKRRYSDSKQYSLNSFRTVFDEEDTYPFFYAAAQLEWSGVNIDVNEEW